MELKDPRDSTKLSRLSACIKCHRIKYCSQECQTADWKTHKKFCGATTMPQPEEVGLGSEWVSQTCQLTGGSDAEARGIDSDGLDRRIQRFVEVVKAK
ncbi:hypothetical protein M427DRAFT_183707 [Gonapodya prolifera JEL478]|uniref:MYND-type domain-containing protein n=1 Tax=Gonapodya prolifera (strain JEL478) TaxID=1344416 RepID=A0A139A0H6_GONPJ|nr:hypothetical protein M427DRAFT_183707 [Gonapodya prolifera JEL478]|eukprot:KXS10286.1 hypothetical protein M427DRAFT_183707 [Gonapodya prolifera JEL478]